MTDPQTTDVVANELCSDPDCALRSDPSAHCWVEPIRHCHRPIAAASFGDLYGNDCCSCSVFAEVRRRSEGRRRSDAISWQVMDRLGREVESSARSARRTQDLIGGVFRVLGDAVRRADESDALATLGETASQVIQGLENALVNIGTQARRLQEAEPDVPGAPESIQSILDEVAQLEEIVGSLLAEGAMVGHRPEALDPGELADRAAAKERDAFERAEVTLTTSREESLPGIEADPGRLLLAVRTILQNAREATPKGGEVTLRTECCDSCVVFEVTDSGPGIPDDRKSRACDPGFTTKGTGTGLGLWLARRVLTRHGGGVELRDAEGGGLVVRLGVPAAS